MHSFGSGALRSSVCCSEGLWGARGQHWLQEAWVPVPFPDAAQLEGREPSKDTQVPSLAHQPWPQFCHGDVPTPPVSDALLDLGIPRLGSWTLESDPPGLAS